jgi:hypothetical protein
VCTISNALYDADTPQIQGQMYCDPPYVWTMMHTTYSKPSTQGVIVPYPNRCCKSECVLLIKQAKSVWRDLGTHSQVRQ